MYLLWDCWWIYLLSYSKWKHTSVILLANSHYPVSRGCFSGNGPLWQFLAGNQRVNLGSLCFDLEKGNLEILSNSNFRSRSQWSCVKRGSFHMRMRNCGPILSPNFPVIPNLSQQSFWCGSLWLVYSNQSESNDCWLCSPLMTMNNIYYDECTAYYRFVIKSLHNFCTLT